MAKKGAKKKGTKKKAAKKKAKKRRQIFNGDGEKKR